MSDERKWGSDEMEEQDFLSDLDDDDEDIDFDFDEELDDDEEDVFLDEDDDEEDFYLDEDDEEVETEGQSAEKIVKEGSSDKQRPKPIIDQELVVKIDRKLESVSGESDLNLYAYLLDSWLKVSGRKDEEFLYMFLELYLPSESKEVGKSPDQILLSFTPEDTRYINLMKRIIPNFEKVLETNAVKKLEGTDDVVGAVTMRIFWLDSTLYKDDPLDLEYVAYVLDALGLQSAFLLLNMEKGDYIKLSEKETSLYKRDVPVRQLVLDTFKAMYYIQSKGNLEFPKEGETQETKKQEPVKQEASLGYEVDELEVENVVNAILGIYDELYAPCFLTRPVGVLTSQGILVVGEDGKPTVQRQGGSYARRLYGYVQGKMKHQLPAETTLKNIDSSYFSKSGDLLDTYSPLYHLYNINGIRSDGEKVNSWVEFRNYLKGDLYRKVHSALSKLPSDQDSIKMQSSLIDLFTTCVIIDKFDIVSSMQIRIKTGSKVVPFGRNLQENASNLFGKGFGEVIHEGSDRHGIYSLLYVFDAKSYASEILFSYKAYENLIRSGNSPDISNVIIGRGFDGRDITVNLGDEQNVLVGILAGSGSGKGVLTLNMLASIYSAGCPAVYLDYKPDMAGTLWEMEKYLVSRGHNARILSIDGKEDRRQDGATPVRSYPYGYNKDVDLPLTNIHYAMFPYLKTLQLAALLASARSTGLFPRREKAFFILDETQGLSRAYMLMIRTLQDYVKGIKGDTPEKAFAEKLINVFGAELRTVLGELRDVTGRTGLVSLILLGQKADPDEWKVIFPDGKVSGWKESFAALLMTSLNLKLIGKSAGNSPSYSIQGLKKKGKEFIDSQGIRGYWALSSEVKPTDATTEIFKSYLTLNNNDFNQDFYNQGHLERMPFTGGVLGGIDDPVQREHVIKNEFLNPDGTLRESVGFLGLMKLISGGEEAQIAEKVSLGYNLMASLLDKLGLSSRYSTVEEYLYDCSSESIFSFAELKDMLENGVSDPGFDGGGTPVEVQPDWFGDEESPVQTTDSEETFDLFDEGGEEAGDEATDSGFPFWGTEAYEMEGTDPGDWGPKIPFPDFDPSTAWQSTPAETDKPAIKKADDYKSPNSRMEGLQLYDKPLPITQSPYKIFGTAERPVSALVSLRNMSEHIVKEIGRIFGSLDRVESIELTGTGLILNNVAFRPTFKQEFIESLPFDIQAKVAQGNVVELLHFKHLRRFRNLTYLRVDNPRLAEGRLRRELEISPKSPWTAIFKKIRSLRVLDIAGQRITDQASAQQYEDTDRGGFNFTERVREAVGLPLNILSDSRMERVWGSRPVRIVTGALGWTLGVKVISVAASLFGPWGLLFGAFAGYGAYREYRRRRE